MSFSGTKGYITKPKPGVQINPLHPLSRGLVGYWLFNEGSGSKAYDISGYGNHGTLTNMSPNAQNSGWGCSKFGSGLQFDGVNDYVEISDSTSLDFTNEITIEVWIRTTMPASHTHIGIVSKWGEADPGDRAYTIAKNHTTDELELLLNGAVLTVTTTWSSINDGSWHHLAATYNGSTGKIYVDGIEEASTDGITAILNSPEPVAIGVLRTDSAAKFPFNGSVDSVRIYNRALSMNEVKQLCHDPFCNLLRVPLRRYSVAVPSVGAIMNQFQKANIGADLYNGVFA